MGLAVAAAVWAGAYLALRNNSGTDSSTANSSGSGNKNTGSERLRILAGVLLAPLGAAGYVLWVGIRKGSPLFGYLDVQGAWGNGFDGGLAFARFIGGLITSTPPAGLALAAGVIALLWLYTRGIRQGQPLPLLVYSGIVMVLALCSSGYFGSKPRLLMPAFPLLIPAAVALARTKAPVVWAVTGLLSAAAAVYGAFWLHGSGPP
ncbi:hypothetical protein GTW66_10525 [Streptomyces sp. SID5473]|uniref:hypothetical protein n=1 Tax=Streptomyces sp. SID5473 TaxID=2690299 RepID=UPI00025CE4DA|nr:hypothetical protein [Streptomyces tsukubensis NRRL18488]MYS64500.1 hypothetical protein [Streptomyces sp. SID5473]